MAQTTGDQARSGGRAQAEVIAVCTSAGGVPKTPVECAEVAVKGLAGDDHAHKKHCRPDRAVLIQDLELLEDLRTEGFPVGPGVMGENITVRGLDVQRLSPGDRVHFADGPILELTKPREPCFVLDAIDPALEEAVVGRGGFFARVERPGRLHRGQRITVEANVGDTDSPA